MASIKVEHVTKEYRLGGFHGPLFKALDDVNFEVKDGEVLGIIGMNGAGKSTLLKLMSKITDPTKGRIHVRGKIAPLIELGAGLNYELTGRENIHLNAAILGLSRAHILKKFDEIVEFAELGEFLEMPIKRYSSGMIVRLGFSVATVTDADILIVDEVLAVGDLAFQRKCFDRMEEMIKRDGKTILFVSHNIRQVERMCKRVLLLDHGKIIADGRPSETCNLFYEISEEKIKGDLLHASSKLKHAQYYSSGEIELLNVSLLDEMGNTVDTIGLNASVTVLIKYKINKALAKPVFGIGVETADLLYLTAIHSNERIKEAVLQPGIYELRCKIDNFPFLPGVYSLCAGVSVGELYRTAFYAEGVFHFQVKAEKVKWAQSMREGFIKLDADWGIAKTNE